MPIFFQIRLFSCFWDGTVVVSINAVCVIYFILWDYSFLEKKTLTYHPEVWLKNIILLLHSAFIILFWFCFFLCFQLYLFCSVLCLTDITVVCSKSAITTNTTSNYILLIVFTLKSLLLHNWKMRLQIALSKRNHWKNGTGRIHGVKTNSWPICRHTKFTNREAYLYLYF